MDQEDYCVRRLPTSTAGTCIIIDTQRMIERGEE